MRKISRAQPKSNQLWRWPRYISMQNFRLFPPCSLREMPYSDGRTGRRMDRWTRRKTVTAGRMDQRTHVQVQEGISGFVRTDGRTDRRMDGQPENIMPSAPKGGGIKINDLVNLLEGTDTIQFKRNIFHFIIVSLLFVPMGQIGRTDSKGTCHWTNDDTAHRRLMTSLGYTEARNDSRPLVCQFEFPNMINEVFVAKFGQTQCGHSKYTASRQEVASTIPIGMDGTIGWG